MKVGTISLGCDKNRVDTEKMLARITGGGHILTDNEADADVIIINTCAFTESAKTEAIDHILDAISKKGDAKKIIVTGCLPERYLESLEEELPEVDAFLGVADYDEILNVIERAAEGDKVYCRGGGDAFCKDRVLTTPYHYAYLKIADGCSNHCTYCAIPSIRGAYRSEKLEDLIEEASILADNGVKELMLVAQDVTRYGVDLYGKPQLLKLVKELIELDFAWIRLLYLEPEAVDDELIELIRTEPKICKYMDIPLQHIDDKVLKRMGRKSTEFDIRKLISKVKEAGIAVRTSFISGFPGESEEAHERLLKFVSEAKIDFAGFFEYSREEGTPADRLSGHIDEDTKKRRADELRAIETEIITAQAKARIGRTYTVIYDDIDYERQCFSGRAQFQAPGIDSQILFTSSKNMDIGHFYEVEIIDTDGIDLIGKII